MNILHSEMICLFWAIAQYYPPAQIGIFLRRQIIGKSGKNQNFHDLTSFWIWPGLKTDSGSDCLSLAVPPLVMLDLLIHTYLPKFTQIYPGQLNDFSTVLPRSPVRIIPYDPYYSGDNTRVCHLLFVRCSKAIALNIQFLLKDASYVFTIIPACTIVRTL